MKTWMAIGLGLLLVAGCPQAVQQASSTVTARIAVTSSQGAAPFTLVASGQDSTSRNEGELTYQWDFGDGTTGEGEMPQHTYSSPGRYLLKLTVIDAEGASDVEAVEIRVSGGDAVAVIAADKVTGPEPLTVQFDATQSVVSGDTILDYSWDFGDGQISLESKPRHTFSVPGEYTVTLRIVTAGGTAASTYTTITVGETNASLQFGSGSFALLTVNGGLSLSACTAETWFRADSQGGTLFSLGEGVVSVEVLPSSNLVRLRVQGRATTANAGDLSGSWQHLAVVVTTTTSQSGGSSGISAGGKWINRGQGTTDTGVCTVYLDGAPLTSDEVDLPLSVERVTLGNGFSGRMGEARLWSVARSSAELMSAASTRLTGAASGLLACWPLDEGTGQTLRNVAGGSSGTLGSSTSTESSDPAWSGDGPPL